MLSESEQTATQQTTTSQLAWESLPVGQQQQLSRLLGHLLYQCLTVQKLVIGQQTAGEEGNERPSANQ
jgi:hypothetical protein